MVVTGQPGKNYTQGKSAKKYEFIFYGTQQQAVPVSPAVMTAFRLVHEDSEECKYWKKQTDALETGIPVFYHTDAKGVPVSIGLAMMYRLAYPHSLHQAIGNTQRMHLQPGHDMADLIFGNVDPEETRGLNNLRGRVNPGLFAALEKTETAWMGPTVLSSPKPSFYPAYLEQPNPDKGLRTLMDSTARLRGWKRYPARPRVGVPRPPNKSENNMQVQVNLETVSAGTRFRGRIRFHNLRQIELGALLWCLDFGNRHHLHHGLGMGKPFGLGQVTLTLKASKVRPNDPAQSAEAEDILAKCRETFT